MTTKKWLKELVREAIREVLSENYHHSHKEYRLYEGDRHITAKFEDNTSLQFEVHYRDKHGEDREKWRKKAASKWKSLASKMHNNVELNEVGNPMQKSWKECFIEALKDPTIQEFIRKPHEQPIYDPQNFTPRT